MHHAVIFVANYFILLSAFLMLWVFIEQPKDKKKELVISGLLGAIFAIVLAKVASHLFYDPRPFVVGHFTPYFSHANDNGFPSDHTLLAAFFTFLAFRYSKRFGTALLLLAILIGFARIHAGVHHLTDIVGSFVFAGMGVSLAVLATKKLNKKTHGHSAQAK